MHRPNCRRIAVAYSTTPGRGAKLKRLVWALLAIAAGLVVYAAVQTGNGDPSAGRTFVGVYVILLALIAMGAVAGVIAAVRATNRSVARLTAIRKARAAIPEEQSAMKQNNYLQIAVLAISVIFIGIGLYDLTNRDYFGSQLAPVVLCGFGLAGVGFLAWLRR